jgi:glyoxylase-like metal-dependent hydrolase (beta-lactamase superfamily II)
MIALGERTVECLATPGHTPGGFCYLTKERVFFPDHGPSITMAEEQTHNPFA